MKELTKQYQLWTYMDGGYQLTEYDTIEKCLLADKYSYQWFITKKVDFKIEEITDK